MLFFLHNPLDIHRKTDTMIAGLGFIRYSRGGDVMKRLFFILLITILFGIACSDAKSKPQAGNDAGQDADQTVKVDEDLSTVDDALPDEIEDVDTALPDEVEDVDTTQPDETTDTTDALPDSY